MQIKTLTRLALLFAFVVVTLGALTRLLDAGLGCPDWPGCYGQILPPSSAELQAAGIAHNGKAWMEMIHRYAAGGLGLVILVMMIRLETDPASKPKSRWLGRSLLLLVIAQALFGMWTVTLKLQPQVVTIHLLGGMLLLALLWLLSQSVADHNRVHVAAGVHKAAMLVMLLLFGQIALGGWTSSQYAGLACPDFPTCQGQWLPDLQLNQAFKLTEFIDANHEGGLLPLDARASIQVVHRYTALLLTVAVLSLSVALWRYPLLRSRVALLLALTGLQLGIGIANVLLQLPLFLALAHNTGSALLLLCLTDTLIRLQSLPTMAANSDKHAFRQSMG